MTSVELVGDGMNGLVTMPLETYISGDGEAVNGPFNSLFKAPKYSDVNIKAG